MLFEVAENVQNGKYFFKGTVLLLRSIRGGIRGGAFVRRQIRRRHPENDKYRRTADMRSRYFPDNKHENGKYEIHTCNFLRRFRFAHTSRDMHNTV